jgi:hypothetical protein
MERRMGMEEREGKRNNEGREGGNGKKKNIDSKLLFLKSLEKPHLLGALAWHPVPTTPAKGSWVSVSWVSEETHVLHSVSPPSGDARGEKKILLPSKSLFSTHLPASLPHIQVIRNIRLEHLSSESKPLLRPAVIWSVI